MRPKVKYFVEQTTLVAVANKIRACEICSLRLFNPVFVVPQGSLLQNHPASQATRPVYS